MGCLGRVLIALAVLAGLLVVGDFVVRALAEREVEQRLQQSDQISGSTQVEINGFPFLLQLARMRFDDVDISGGEIGNGQLQLTRFTANLNGVRPSSDRTSARVDAMAGSAFISYADLQRAVSRPGVTVGPGDDGQVKVTGSVTVLGRTVSASTQSKISVVDGNQLRVSATEIQVPGLTVNSTVVRLVGQRLDFVVQVPNLPEGLRLVDVQVGPEGITADVQGQDVLLQS